MSKEWSSEFNPFNSWKVVMARPWLEGIIKGEFLPPLTCDTDLSNRCQLNCKWCNTQIYRKTYHEDMPYDHALRLADFYAEWGIKSTCIAGGGESLLNPVAPEFIRRLHKNGIEVGIITNGLYMTDELVEVISDSVRYIGVSLDAGNPDTYELVKGVPKNNFNKVTTNIERLSKAMRSKKENLPHDITIKFLITPDTFRDIYQVTELAKNLGCYAVHIRPVGLVNLRNETYKNTPKEFDFSTMLVTIDELIDKSRGLEDENFKVFAPRSQKFGPSMSRTVKFKKCQATPLHIVFAADGWTHICFNLRDYENSRLVKHYPDPSKVKEFWCSKEHKELIDKIDPVNRCPRCTFTHYNLVLENMIAVDSCYWKFV